MYTRPAIRASNSKARDQRAEQECVVHNDSLNEPRTRLDVGETAVCSVVDGYRRVQHP